MEQSVFNPEVFKQTIVILKQLANLHQPANEQAAAAHNQVYFQKGEAASSQISDVAEVANPEQVGKAIVEFVRTIPGVATDNEMVRTVSQPISIALSDRAVSALLRRGGGGEVGMGLTFAYEGWPKHKLVFERIDAAHKRVAVDIEIGLDSVPRDGEINVGEKENGQFVINRHSIQFDANGVVLKDFPAYGLQAGEKINIVQVIQQITSPDNLGSPINAGEIISKAKPLKIEG